MTQIFSNNGDEIFGRWNAKVGLCAGVPDKQGLYVWAVKQTAQKDLTYVDTLDVGVHAAGIEAPYGQLFLNLYTRSDNSAFFCSKGRNVTEESNLQKMQTNLKTLILPNGMTVSYGEKENYQHVEIRAAGKDKTTPGRLMMQMGLAKNGASYYGHLSKDEFESGCVLLSQKTHYYDTACQPIEDDYFKQNKNTAENKLRQAFLGNSDPLVIKYANKAIDPSLN